ncbi:hypothetical protein CIB48_g9948 [Xylaria polymorpha]|nr:hypothetical protein CIB48_g9948 [Xylaria polymorpha]
MSSTSDPAVTPAPETQDPMKQPVDPDISDPGASETGIIAPVLASTDVPETTKWEIWSWYAFYIGANGLALFNFGPTAFQNLLSQAAPEDTGLLRFAGRDRNVNSIVLLTNGISFAIQAALFIIIGSYADFGSGRRWILVFWSIVSFGIGFAWLGVHVPSRWEAGVGLYVVGLICYQLTLTYWTAAFPSLARNTPHLKEAARAYAEGEISQVDYDRQDEMERSRLSNTAFCIQSLGEVVILAIIVGILFGVDVNASTEANNWGLSVLIAFATAVWLVLSIPWFLIEKKRPGLKIPPGMNIVSVGFWQLKEALTKIWHLKQSLIYLVGYFLLGDSLNTTVTVIATLQNEVVSYDTLTLTYLLIVGIVAQAVGIAVYWWLQRRYEISAKMMFNVVMVGIVLLDGWGMIGNWTDNFGFHHVWEIWLYQAFYGLFVCQWYSYSQIIISSVTPRGHEFLFFSLFTIVARPPLSSAPSSAAPSSTRLPVTMTTARPFTFFSHLL